MEGPLNRLAALLLAGAVTLAACSTEDPLRPSGAPPPTLAAGSLGEENPLRPSGAPSPTLAAGSLGEEMSTPDSSLPSPDDPVAGGGEGGLGSPAGGGEWGIAPALQPLDRSVEATEQRLAADVAALVAIGPRPAGGDAERAAARMVASLLGEAATTVFIESVPLPAGATSRNLWATFGHGDRSILLGAHYDSIAASPGANDNGSGVAILIELARRLADQPIDGITVTIVLFGAEEIITGFTRNHHHFGSRHRAERLDAEDGLPDLMASIDMVGVGDRLLAVTYRDTDPTAAQLAVEAAARVGIDVALASRGDISDHEAFARAGVPSVFLWRPDDPAYHTARDDGVEAALLLDVLSIVEQTLVLATAR